jgi:hypothetical protein
LAWAKLLQSYPFKKGNFVITCNSFARSSKKAKIKFYFIFAKPTHLLKRCEAITFIIANNSTANIPTIKVITIKVITIKVITIKVITIKVITIKVITIKVITIKVIASF